MTYRITITHTDPAAFGEQELITADSWASVAGILEQLDSWLFDAGGFIRIERVAAPTGSDGDREAIQAADDARLARLESSCYPLDR